MESESNLGFLIAKDVSQNPNELDSKVLVEFDHVKKGLKLDEEDLRKMKEDPTYNINISGDLKQMLKDLGTEKAKLALLHGGGGLKAQKERAAALAAIAASKSETENKSSKSSEDKPMQSFSIVDAASASVHGRSAAAAKAGASEKTAARIALHMAGDRTPVNVKLDQRSFDE